MAKDLAPWEGDMAGELLLQLLSRISWSLDRTFADSFTYVIGDNGTGKSHLLAALSDQLVHSEHAPGVVCISNSLYDRFKLKGPPGYQYLGARSASNAIFRTSLDRQLFEQLLVAKKKDSSRFEVLSKELGLDFEFTLLRYQLGIGTPKAGRNDPPQSDARPLSGRAAKLAAQFLGPRHRFDTLGTDEIDALLNLVPLRPTIAVSVRSLGGGDWLKFALMSSGEQNRILLMSKVVAAMETNTVLLIDEPEISLHLHWQMDFHKSLKGLLEGFRSVHVVVATHSPILVSEAAKTGPKSQSDAVVILRSIAPLGVLSAETSVPMVPIQYAMHTFAEVASHDQLVLRYFETAPYQGREVSVEIADALLRVAEGKSPDQSVQSLNALKQAKGLEPEQRRHIVEAMRLIEGGIVASVARDLDPGVIPAGDPKEG